MKKVFTLFAAAGLAVSAISANIYGFKGTGTEADPYQIEKAADFYTLAEKITAENTGAGEYFKVTADIDFGGSESTPALLPSVAKAGITSISNVSFGFQGILDGNGKKIRGIYHNEFGNNDKGKFNALISSLGDGGLIKNLTFTADNYVKSYNYTALFVSLNTGTIENCENNAAITGTNSFAGGICGCIIKGKGYIKGCNNHGNIVAMSFAGGIIGGSQSGSKLSNSDAGYANVIVEDCLNTGSISTTNGTGSGGIAGNYSGVIRNCENRGTIDDSKGTSKAKKYTGGIVSAMTYVAGLTGNVNSGEVTGVEYVGGIVGCILKAADEPVDISGNTNTGNVSGTGTTVGDILGGSLRTAQVTTPIQIITTDPVSGITAPAYNLLGQRVEHSTKGIVIINGKKYLNR